MGRDVSGYVEMWVGMWGCGVGCLCLSIKSLHLKQRMKIRFTFVYKEAESTNNFEENMDEKQLGPSSPKVSTNMFMCLTSFTETQFCFFLFVYSQRTSKYPSKPIIFGDDPVGDSSIYRRSFSERFLFQTFFYSERFLF